MAFCGAACKEEHSASDKVATAAASLSGMAMRTLRRMGIGNSPVALKALAVASICHNITDALFEAASGCLACRLGPIDERQ